MADKQAFPCTKTATVKGRRPTHYTDFFDERMKSHFSTANENVKILSQHFYIPQLKRTRRIWVCLPEDYYTSGKQYPVLYLQDAQNKFDEATSFGLEWEVDESLSRLFRMGDRGVIAVGIDHGRERRIHEYLPFPNQPDGLAEGPAYAEFLVTVLKPFIDVNFRTLPGKSTTALMGSSMGGLISLYTGLMYPEVFGLLGIFSPSLWIAPDIFPLIEKRLVSREQKIYLLAGKRESKDMALDMQKLHDALAGKGLPPEQLHLTLVKDGEHTEAFWRKEFPYAYLWLFGHTLACPWDIGAPIHFFPNPANDFLHITFQAEGQKALCKLYDWQGSLLMEQWVATRETIAVKHLPVGLYFLEIQHEGTHDVKALQINRSVKSS